MERKCIVGIEQDNLIGYRLKLYLIEKDKNLGFFPVIAQISSMNYSIYSNELSEKEKSIFIITEEYTDRELFEIFSSKKDKSVKDFINKLKKDVAVNKIKPFIEFKIVEILKILRQSETELYLKDTPRYIDRSKRINYFRNYSRCIWPNRYPQCLFILSVSN